MSSMAPRKRDDGDWTARHARIRPRENRPVAVYDPEDGRGRRRAMTKR